MLLSLDLDTGYSVKNIPKWAAFICCQLGWNHGFCLFTRPFCFIKGRVFSFLKQNTNMQADNISLKGILQQW